MSKRSPELFIQDMLEAIEKIERYTESIEDSEDFKGKDIVADAVLRNLESTGEAAGNIPGEIRSKYSEIPWNRVAELRTGKVTRLSPGIASRLMEEFLGLLKDIKEIRGEEIIPNPSCRYCIAECEHSSGKSLKGGSPERNLMKMLDNIDVV
ncbi:HepT-like ribonuclease domain-containing protein [Geoglobus acetivorans]|uniref:DUF86 domain-containing protein n=1 Tax=Geoglobus acetivorans TaxID=565033 RepID=A0ABZ3H548_GEOAI|nr:DUF86 domain-containing protein [Geoglobus acetivorans]